MAPRGIKAKEEDVIEETEEFDDSILDDLESMNNE
jgi:hypothetical protein